MASFDEETAKRVLHQVEFYFSDSNLPRDEFLRKSVAGSKDGMVSLALICSFSRMRTHLGLGNLRREDIHEQIVKAVGKILRKSNFLKVSKDGKRVGRVTELSKPEQIIEEVDTRTIAVSPLEHDVKIEGLEAFFAHYGKVNSVRLPRHMSDKRYFCGTALIEFSADVDAEEVLKQHLVYAGTDLELKPKKQFDSEREKMTEDIEKATPKCSSNKNDANSKSDYIKGLIVAFSFKCKSLGRLLKKNGKSESINYWWRFSSIRKDLESQNLAVKRSNLSMSSEDDVNCAGQHNKKKSKNVERVIHERSTQRDEKTEEGKEEKDAEDTICQPIDKSLNGFCRDSESKVTGGDASTASVQEETDIISSEDLKDFFQRFGALKFVDYTVGAESGYVIFEEPNAAIKARATAAFVEDGFVVKKKIVSLAAVSGEAERIYWKSFPGCEKCDESREEGKGRDGKSDSKRKFDGNLSLNKGNDSAVGRPNKSQKVEEAI